MIISVITQEEYKHALQQLERLLTLPDSSNDAELFRLTQVVDQYEEENHPFQVILNPPIIGDNVATHKFSDLRKQLPLWRRARSWVRVRITLTYMWCMETWLRIRECGRR
jgi:hypothetical protein